MPADNPNTHICHFMSQQVLHGCVLILRSCSIRGCSCSCSAALSSALLGNRPCCWGLLLLLPSVIPVRRIDLRLRIKALTFTVAAVVLQPVRLPKVDFQPDPVPVFNLSPSQASIGGADEEALAATCVERFEPVTGRHEEWKRCWREVDQAPGVNASSFDSCCIGRADDSCSLQASEGGCDLRAYSRRTSQAQHAIQLDSACQQR